MSSAFNRGNGTQGDLRKIAQMESHPPISCVHSGMLVQGRQLAVMSLMHDITQGTHRINSSSTMRTAGTPYFPRQMPPSPRSRTAIERSKHHLRLVLRLPHNHPVRSRCALLPESSAGLAAKQPRLSRVAPGKQQKRKSSVKFCGQVGIVFELADFSPEKENP